MSAVVGFRCRNGIVLCAHQQTSAAGAFKSNERRITIEVEPHQSMVLACSGLPAETSEFREEIRKKLGNAEIPSDLLYLAVNEVLTDMCGQSPSMDLQLLIGRAAASEYPTLLEFTGKALHVAGDVSFLGGGISPVPRFLAATMFSPQMDIEEATNLAIYLPLGLSPCVDGDLPIYPMSSSPQTSPASTVTSIWPPNATLGLRPSLPPP